MLKARLIGNRRTIGIILRFSIYYLYYFSVFPPSVQIGDELKWDKAYPIQVSGFLVFLFQIKFKEYPVQSAFCIPASGSSVKRSDEEIAVAGYAWSGGGRGIIRVEVYHDTFNILLYMVF